MKKRRILTIVTAFLLLVQNFAMPVYASETVETAVEETLLEDGVIKNGIVSENALNETEAESTPAEGTQWTDEAGFVWNGTVIIGYTGEKTDIVIPAKAKKIADYAFQNNTALTSVTIGQKVTNIGAGAFEGCSNLTKVKIPTGVKAIGTDAIPKNEGLAIYAVKDSYAYKWANKNAYTVIRVYKITYTLNGGTDEMGNPFLYEQGEELTLADPVKKGYTFEGWYKDSELKKPFTYTTSTKGNLALYAKWKAIKYTIEYETNGGTLAAKSPVSYKVTAAVTLKNPKKTGYTFQGWYLDEACTEGNRLKAIKKGSTGDIKLYAAWTENVYKIKFTKNGSNVTGTQEAVTGCVYDTEVTLPSCALVRPGYTFAGWNTKANGKGTSYEDGATVKNLVSANNGVATLYAQWDAISYSITYHLDGGENHAKNPESYTCAQEITLKNPKKAGYTFKGWYTDATFTKKIVKIKKGSTEAKEVFAKWNANKYTVAFKANGGTGKMTSLKNCVYDQTYTLPGNTFKKSGLDFLGWNTKKDGTGTAIKNEAQILNLATANGATVNLFAQWGIKKEEGPVEDEKDYTEWKNTAITYPAKSQLVAAGTIDITFNKLDDAPKYDVYVDDQLVKTVEVSDTDTSTYSVEIRNVDVAKHTTYVVATLPDGDTVTSNIRTFFISKKGIGIWQSASEKVEELNLSWYYNWSPYELTGVSEQVEFVPMIWGDEAGGGADRVNEWNWMRAGNYKDYRHLLTFNEPDFPDQSNMTPDRAVELWPAFETAREAGVKVSSPAVAIPTVFYGDANNDYGTIGGWYGKYEQLMATAEYHDDFTAVHFYFDYPGEYILDTLAQIHEKTGKPIWITEWGVGQWTQVQNFDWTGGPDEGNWQREIIVEFVENILPQFDEIDYIERYAWFPFDGSNTEKFGNGAGGLFFNSEDDPLYGQLTSVGKAYARLGNPEGYDPSNPVEDVPVED